MRTGRFNIPIVGWVVDLIFMAVAISTTAYFWYNTRGVAEIEAKRGEVQATADEAQGVINERLEAIADAEAQVREAEARRDSIIALTKEYTADIPVQVDKIAEARQKAQDMTAQSLQLRGRLGTQRDRLRDLRQQVETLTDQAADLAATEAVQRDSLFANEQRRLALVRDVEEMIAYRERDPWSMFPVSASLAAYVEFTEDANFLTFSLAKDFYRRGNLDFGVSGALGFGNEQGTSLREAGLYANVELAFRRLSLDLGAGYSSLQVGTAEDSGDPYASAILRWAPYYRERAFLLAGTKLAHGELSYLLGVGFGRR